MARSDNRIGKLLFGLYCAFMLWLLFGQRIGWITEEGYWEQLKANVNLVPFHTISNYIRVLGRTSNAGLLRHIVINLAGNVVMFVPLGFFLPLNWARFRRVRRLILWGILIIVAVESLQLVTLLGSLDVDDLILNVAGVLIGYSLWRGIWREKT